MDVHADPLGAKGEKLAQDIATATRNDRLLRMEQTLPKDSSEIAQKCEEVCPSCGMDGRSSKMASLMQHFEIADGKGPPTFESCTNVFFDFGGSKAHSVIPQSLLRDQTRRILDDFMRSQKFKSPCIFADPNMWSTFESGYIAQMLDICSEPLASQVGKEVLQKAEAAKVYRQHPKENDELLSNWIGQWKKETPPVSPQLGSKAEITDSSSDEPTQDQKRKAGNLKKNAPQTSGVQSIMKNGDLVLFWKEGGDANYIVSEYTIGPEGNTKSGVKRIFENKVETGTVDLMKATGKTTEVEWVGEVFSNVMDAPFTVKVQCRYCETLQGDATLIQRMKLAGSGGLPPEYVGKEIVKLERERFNPPNKGEKQAFPTPEKYTQAYLEDVSVSLYERVRKLCKGETDALKKDTSKLIDIHPDQLSAAQNWSENVVAQAVTGAVQHASAQQILDAVQSAIGTLIGKVSAKEPNLSLNQVSGVARTLLKEAGLQIADNKGFNTTVEKALQADDRLEFVPGKRPGYKPK